MKRLFYIILSLFTCLILLAACRQEENTHIHFFEEWSLLQPATCSASGKEQSACACGVSEIRAIPATGDHAFGAWQITAPAACTANGEETRACACGATETRVIPATGDHAFGAWEITAFATCAANGEEARTCACGVSEIRAIPATGDHAFGAWQIVALATCTANGEETRTCACGASETRTLSATGQHEYDSENTCARCGDYKDKGVVFTVREDSCIVSGYTGNAAEVILPSHYQGKPVVAIGAQAFQLCTDLVCVTVPYTVEEIGDYAFSGERGGWGKQSPAMSLSCVHFAPDSRLERIGNGVFWSCTALESICIPASVKSIGCEVFYGCDALALVYFEQTSGWARAHVYSPGTVLPVEPGVLGDPAVAADLLKGSWYWARAM